MIMPLILTLIFGGSYTLLFYFIFIRKEKKLLDVHVSYLTMTPATHWPNELAFIIIIIFVLFKKKIEGTLLLNYRV